MPQKNEKRPKIARQVSVALLGFVSVVSLLLSAGLVMFTSDAPGGTDYVSETVPPLADPQNLIEEPGPLEHPLDIDNDAGESLALTLSCILVVMGFALVWFLVFRPGDASEPPVIDTKKPQTGQL